MYFYLVLFMVIFCLVGIVGKITGRKTEDVAPGVFIWLLKLWIILILAGLIFALVMMIRREFF